MVPSLISSISSWFHSSYVYSSLNKPSHLFEFKYNFSLCETVQVSPDPKTLNLLSYNNLFQLSVGLFILFLVMTKLFFVTISSALLERNILGFAIKLGISLTYTFALELYLKNFTNNFIAFKLGFSLLIMNSLYLATGYMFLFCLYWSKFSMAQCSGLILRWVLKKILNSLSQTR